MENCPFSPFRQLKEAPEGESSEPAPDKPNAGTLEGTRLGVWSVLYRACFRALSMNPVTVDEHSLSQIAILLGVHEPHEPEVEAARNQRESDRRKLARGRKPGQTARGNPKGPGIKNMDLLRQRMAHARDPENNPKPEADVQRANQNARVKTGRQL